MAAPTLLAAAVTDRGKVRPENEDAHGFDAEAGIAILCDGMGGHQAGEVASALAVSMVKEAWTGPAVTGARDAWLRTGTPQARRALFAALRNAVMEANAAIVAQAEADRTRQGMGTTFTGIYFAGGEALLAHAGDSRAYLVRDGRGIRLTDDHTLLARLAEAGVDTSAGESRWKGVVTNALGVGGSTWVASAAVPLADGDRFLLCSDGVSEYLSEEEIGEVLTREAAPSRAARRLVDLALERGGHDNATAVVVKVVESGGVARSAATRARDEESLGRCPLFAELSPQRRLRVLRVASEHAIDKDEPVAARFLGDRVAWIVLDGRVTRGGEQQGRGSLLYAESLVGDDSLPAGPEWTAMKPLRALALRADDVAELASDEPDVGEKLYAAVAEIVGRAVRRRGDTGDF